jgi:hypothetical protein
MIKCRSQICCHRPLWIPLRQDMVDGYGKCSPLRQVLAAHESWLMRW